MNEETQIIEKPKPDRENRNSAIMGVSLRGWIALMITATVCVMSLIQRDIKEPLYTLAGLVIGFYFAQSQQKKQETKP
jgi:hypothetical protein